MRVLFATTHAYLPQRVGGSEVSTHDLCVTLRERGVEVAVLSGFLPRRPVDGEARRNPFPLRRVGIARDEAQGYPVFRTPDPMLAVRDMVRDYRPDIAVIQAGYPLALAPRFAALGVPTLVYLRDAFFDELGGAVRDHPALRYVAVSQDLAHRFAAAFGIVPLQIPPLVRRERYHVQSQRRNVTFVCPLPVKGVEIAWRLARRRRDLPFVFVESWPLNPARRLILHCRAASAGNVTVHAPTLDMRSVYRDTKVLLVPSLCFEAWGRVVSEAQASAIPALASSRGGLPESVGAGGSLVDPDAATEEWENALSRMWDDAVEYERLSDHARQHALRPDFQPSVIVSRLQALFADVIARWPHEVTTSPDAPQQEPILSVPAVQPLVRGEASTAGLGIVIASDTR